MTVLLLLLRGGAAETDMDDCTDTGGVVHLIDVPAGNNQYRMVMSPSNADFPTPS